MVVALAELDPDLDAAEEGERGGRRACRRRAEARRRRGRGCGRPRPSPHGEEEVAAEELDPDPRAGSPRSVSRTWRRDGNHVGIVFLPRGRARALPHPLRSLPSRSPGPRARGSRRRAASGSSTSRPGRSARRSATTTRASRGRALGARRGHPPELVDALGAGARARGVGLFPAPLDRVLLLNTGTEANEVALKMAKMHTGRWEVVGLTRSFHGLLRHRLRQLLDGARRLRAGAARSPAIPAPYAYRCPVRHCDGACDCTCLEVGFELVDQQSVGALCALVAEPVLSAGDHRPADGYFRRVRELLDERGMLVMDEAQTGFGRLGTMFGFEHDGRAGLRRRLEDARRRVAPGRDDHVGRDRAGLLQGLPPRHPHVSDPLPAAAGSPCST